MAGEKARTERGSKMSFRARMAVCFGVIAVITTALFVIVLSVSWNEEFHNYTRSTLQELADSAAASLERSYATKGYWSASDLENAASSAESFDDIGVQISDAKGRTVYDSTFAASGQTASSYVSDMSLAPSASQMVTVDVLGRSDESVGSVSVWVYGSEYLLTQRDESFRSNSFKAIGVAGVAAVLLSIVLGFIASRTLTAPVRAISHTAARIKEGELSARCGIKGKDDLGQLGETFDEMAEKIENDRELEKRLTNDMAHELRTPLMSMLATVEAMQDGVYACDQEHLALVRSEITRLSRLVDGMLSLSRLENGSVRMKIEQVDAVDFVAGITATHKAMLEEVGLDLRFENDYDSDELEVELDRDTITQAVTNLISNAMRYTPAPGTVTVHVGRDGDEALISVQDTGIGIAKEDISRVFGRFWRAEESRNRAKGGLGVGLAVTKEIIDHHHGKITVDSTLGVGTTFTLRLPLKQPKED